MVIFRTIYELQLWLAQQRIAGQSIGFAPTMGALHDGHLDLVRKTKAHGDVAVVSIFVNPTQFNDPKDLEKYPRMPEQDAALLQTVGCDAIFLPEVSEIYPPGKDLTLRIDLSPLDTVMEGVFRPGHFTGMATVVKRLVDIVQPHRLYMGQKDYQQMTIVRAMLYRLGSTTELVPCETVREADGLAKSSRNLRLTPEMRAAAPHIYRILSTAKADFPTKPPREIEAWAMSELTRCGFRPEYFDIVDGITLLPVEAYEAGRLTVACTAAWAGEVRLIDNILV